MMNILSAAQNNNHKKFFTHSLEVNAHTHNHTSAGVLLLSNCYFSLFGRWVSNCFEMQFAVSWWWMSVRASVRHILCIYIRTNEEKNTENKNFYFHFSHCVLCAVSAFAYAKRMKLMNHTQFLRTNSERVTLFSCGHVFRCTHTAKSWMPHECNVCICKWLDGHCNLSQRKSRHTAALHNHCFCSSRHIAYHHWAAWKAFAERLMRTQRDQISLARSWPPSRLVARTHTVLLFVFN